MTGRSAWLGLANRRAPACLPSRVPGPGRDLPHHTYAAKWSLGVNESLALESFSSGNSACMADPTAAPYLCVLATLTVQQEITYFVHAFYGYRPPPGWRFTTDGDVPAPPA
jgi:hypothetical protein